MLKIISLILTVLLCCPVMPYPVCAETGQPENKAPETKELFEMGIEYFHPIYRDRQIHTTVINIRKRSNYLDDFLLTTYAGLTINYAWGHIIEDDPYHRRTEYANSAFGIGPMVHSRWSPVTLDDLTLSVDASGGIIFHNKAFPAGGDYYNFICRIGPSISYPLKDKQALIFGFGIMHVSNGQGVNRDNPTYNAAGFSLSFSRYF